MNEQITCPECGSDEIEPLEMYPEEELGCFVCNNCDHEFETNITEDDF